MKSRGRRRESMVNGQETGGVDGVPWIVDSGKAYDGSRTTGHGSRMMKWEVSMSDERKPRIIVHDDFDNLFTGLGVEDDHAAELESRAAVHLRAEADIVSLLAALPETTQYCPARAGEFVGTHEGGSNDFYVIERRLAAAGIDPYGIVVGTLRKAGCPVLAKLRVSDWHHLAPGLEGHASRFWLEHPEWRIGAIEAREGTKTSFDGLSCIGPHFGEIIVEHRGDLLDYAVPEVRRRRLEVVREFLTQYDVEGLTLNFIRDPMCLSFPERNAPLLTEFVAECRKTVADTVGKRRRAPIMGAIVPWQFDLCRVMGLDVEHWLSGGYFDYVSPTDGFVSDFNMAIEPWVDLASRSPRRCAVYPGIIGYRSYAPHGKDTEDEFRSNVTHENVRALAHGFYAEGADGVSFFNFYSGVYNYLYPLTDLCLPERLEGRERHYVYMKWPLYQECSFLKLVIEPTSKGRKTLSCRLHEDLKKVDAHVGFKALRLRDIRSLRVDINGSEVPGSEISLIPNEGKGCLRAQFALRDGMLRDGANEMGFALRSRGAGENVVIQEVEIRVRPR